MVVVGAVQIVPREADELSPRPIRPGLRQVTATARFAGRAHVACRVDATAELAEQRHREARLTSLVCEHPLILAIRLPGICRLTRSRQMLQMHRYPRFISMVGQSQIV
ncbi:hypothetical protein B1964_07675 [Gordonia sp. i37]|nr:hypothetical protein B1964_07675 [Gordonia sp. i37]